MLGGQTFFMCLAVPTIAGGLFYCTRKQLSYQWRDELMDSDGSAYPALTQHHMQFLRRVNAPNGDGRIVKHADNVGLRVEEDVLPQSDVVLFLNEVRRLSRALGNPLDQQQVDYHQVAAEKERSAFISLQTAKHPMAAFDTDFLKDIRIVSDHAEDTQLMQAPWGTGDSIRPEHIPLSLRYLTSRVASLNMGVGRLRHIYMVYSPSGEFFQKPTVPKTFDGHEYVIIPLRRDGKETVITFSPAFRSKYSTAMSSIMENSWTTRDIDCLVPSGGMLKVYGAARYEWGWSVRPGATWFGSRTNPIRDFMSKGKLLEDGQACGAGGGFWNTLRHWCMPPPHATWKPPIHQSQGTSDAAMIMFHFEGPRAKGRQRSLLLHPESLVFGSSPTVQTFQKWASDEPPSEDSVWEYGVLKFVMTNYFDMLRYS